MLLLELFLDICRIRLFNCLLNKFRRVLAYLVVVLFTRQCIWQFSLTARFHSGFIGADAHNTILKSKTLIYYWNKWTNIPVYCWLDIYQIRKNLQELGIYSVNILEIIFKYNIILIMVNWWKENVTLSKEIEQGHVLLT